MQNFLDQSRRFLSSKSLKPVETLFLAVILVLGFTRDISSVEFFPDESFWIVSSVRLDKFLAGDFESPIWTDDLIVAFEVRPIPSYFARIGQLLGGISADSLPIYWHWNVTESENIAMGAMPTDEEILWSRFPMAVLSAFTLLITAILLARSHSRLAAYIFTVISLNGYFMVNLRRAMSEASILFFTVLAMYASYRLVTAARNGDMSKSIQWSLAAGLLSGLAGQSKLTGLACAGIAIIGAMFVLIRTPAQLFSILKQRLLLVIVFLVSISTLAIFIASYPFFYKDTVDRIWETFHVRSQIVEYQLHTYTDTLIPSNSRLTILFQRIMDYPMHSKSNRAVNVATHWGNLLAVILGMYHVIKRARGDTSERDACVILLLGTLLCATPMLFNPFDWERYYLYPIFFSCIFFAVGISQQVLNFSTREKTI